MKEQVTVTLTRYKTPKAEPTCALSEKEICTFLRFRSFGQYGVCELDPTSQILDRRDGKNGPGMGYLIPCEGCLVWAEGSKRKPKAKRPSTCYWEVDSSGEFWGTECFNLFQFSNLEGPKGNGFKHCPYCGRKIVYGREG